MQAPRPDKNEQGLNPGPAVGASPVPFNRTAGLMAAVTIAIAVACSMSFAEWNLNHTFDATRRILLDTLLFSALAVPAAFFLARALFVDRPQPIRASLREIGALAVSAAVLGAVIVRNGYYQFDATQHGWISELAYRQSLGQVTNRDFYMSLPYDYVFGARLLFPLFGISWGAFVFSTALIAVLALFWHYGMLRELGWTPLPALLLTFTVQTMVSVVNSYYYYNQLASMASISLLLATWYVIHRPRRALAWLSFVAAFLWVLMAKPNGYLMLPASLLAVALSGKRSALLGGLSAILSVGLWGVIARLSNVQILPILQSLYDASKNRMTLFGNPFFGGVTIVEVASLYIFLLPCVVGWMIASVPRLRAAWSSPPARGRAAAEAVVGAASIFTGMVFAQTNAVLKSSDLCVPLTAWAIAMFSERCHDAAGEPRWGTRWQAANRFAYLLVCMFFVFSSLSWGHVRRFIQTGGPGFGRNPIVHKDVPEFFRGQAMGDWFYSVVSGMVRFNDVIGKGKSVYFGPRLGFGYPTFGIRPAEGLPVHWQEGVGYPKTQTDELVNNFISKKFDYLVFLSFNLPDGRFTIDAIFMNQKLLNYIFANYVLDTRMQSVVLLRRR